MIASKLTSTALEAILRPAGPIGVPVLPSELAQGGTPAGAKVLWLERQTSVSLTPVALGLPEGSACV